MLKSYLGLQQDELEKLGQERRRLREIALQEEQRAHKLQEVIAALRPGAEPFHPLLWQNRQQMDGQLRKMLSHQVQQSTLARMDLDHHEGVMRQQVGRVKGLELLLARRAAQGQQQQEKRDQHQLDELASLRYLARGG
ncbi:lateral flagellar protein LfiJ [Aeromonas enteropelogenes]|uniref:Flagellar FliJ protein n=2 Tax=Aeromonas TaxID=642 RepID=A0A175VHM0_AEREN|nr:MULTISPECIES: lateral flagellar protein LfiJ [Aeromonas]KXU79788.1 flagellar protein [Aeromonas enteropelogenes]MBL0458093.1 lateral flagellar protein LfiJ [Aeromonas enteropelogenes]MBL0521830.1 lateral flagellar protein LfiJ [Aeromonas enteropelogenes]MCZ0752101.1 lateral flagellar protein LfiJ [Aeromonas enteropelogenes]QXC35275.1 lateral flagellar protein LfiJ [Aeromonas sp. FDAARGOS 1407]